MSHIVVDQKGPPCPRCGRPTQVRRHNRIRQKQLRQPYYYEQWFYCAHDDCKTKQIMPDEFKVWNDPTPEQERLVAELTEAYARYRSARRL